MATVAPAGRLIFLNFGMYYASAYRNRHITKPFELLSDPTVFGPSECEEMCLEKGALVAKKHP